MILYKLLATLMAASLCQAQADTDTQPALTSVLEPPPVTGDSNSNEAKLLEYKSSFNEILKDLINNWQSPIRYLKSRGYLPKELEHEMHMSNLADPLDATQDIGSKTLQDVGSKHVEQVIQKKASVEQPLQRGTRAAVNENGLIGNLKGIITNLLVKKDDANKNLRSIPLDIDELKMNAKKEAHKYYEDVLKKLVDAGELKENVTEKVKVERSNVIVQLPEYLKWDLKENALRFTNSSKEQYLSGLVRDFAEKSLPKTLRFNSTKVVESSEEEPKAD